MAPKKGGKGGWPRKYTIEEAQATKQAQDRQRQHQLQHARVDGPDSNGFRVVIAEAPYRSYRSYSSHSSEGAHSHFISRPARART